MISEFSIFYSQLVSLLNDEFGERISNRVIADSIFFFMMFLWFLQSKDRPFLQILLDKAILKDLNFFQDYLSPLCFGTLNAKEEELTEFYDIFSFVQSSFKNSYYQNHIFGFHVPNNFFSNLFENCFNKFYWSSSEFQYSSVKKPIISPNIFEKLYIKGSENKKELGKVYTPFELAMLLCQSCIFVKIHSRLLKEHKQLSLQTNSLDFFKSLDQLSTSEFWHFFPPQIHQQLVSIILDEISDFRVLDPAIGTGSLILTYLQVCLTLYSQLNRITNFLSPSPVSFLYSLVSNIAGIDIDPIALEICSFRLWLYIFRFLQTEEQYKLFSTLKLNLHLKDTLLNDEPDSSWDLILANPPFVDIKTLTSERTKQLMSRFQTVSHRINLFSLFLEYSHKCLTATGVLGFIIPASFLYGTSYRPLRELLIQTGLIKRVIRLPEQIFPEIQ
ncbi:MAG: class I SAM-dependent DNA methyltransferase [Candidatus Hodarchaeota archaeon]